MGCHSILRGIFPTQGSNLGLLHCRRVLYYLCHQGSPTLGGYKTSLVAQMVKNPPAVQETQVQSLGWEIPRERNGYPLQYSWVSQVALVVKNSPLLSRSKRHKRHRFSPGVGKISCRRAWQPTPVFLPWKSHGQRSMPGYSP